MHCHRGILSAAAGWLAAICLAGAAANGDQPTMKQVSVFYPKAVAGRAHANAKKYPWAAEIRERLVAAARPWMKLSDDELWSLMFGHTLRRSWMVWSSGHCPACKKPVPMYNWRIDAMARPWKVQCPHCKAFFPTNDFRRFHLSGLDERGVFDPRRADRKLLFNAEHPGPAGRLHTFGVDDGEGYAAGGRRWRFIGAYLIYGQWKQAVVGGIDRLSAAHVVTGEPAYARKAGVLLDRVADLYPTFDFGKQGILYERGGDRGYVSTWHDASPEVRSLAVAYDRVFEAIKADRGLVAFLSGKARRHKLDNPKASFADVQRNIEQRIFVDTLAHRGKIESNYPSTDVTLAVITSVLDRPGGRPRARAMIDRIVARCTRVDGLTGEKGLAGYATIGPRTLAEMLEMYAQADPAFLPALLKRHPKLHQTYRFHVDTRCLGRYYPLSGDTGSFARKIGRYAGVSFRKQGLAGPAGEALPPSAHAFLWRLHEHTGDAAFVQVLHEANGGSVKGLPHDVFAADPAGLQKKVAEVIAREGSQPALGSVNKRQWCLAILRSGRGQGARAVWLDYDCGCGNHSHRDGMNLGLFAKGLDLMPDFGYPPVQFGGWGSARARWYAQSAAHNTVVVDGRDLANAAGKTTLWADGKAFRAVRASAAGMCGGRQYERTAAMVDVSDRDCYVVDVFRVVGGRDHAKFVHSHFGRASPAGLSLRPGGAFRGALMRSFRTDPAAKPPWSVDWRVEDRHGYLPAGADVHLRYTDLTAGAAASLAEAWVVAGIYDSTEEVWIPRVMVRRQGSKPPLASTFAAVIEPYEKRSNVARIRRLRLAAADGAACPEANVAVEVALADGRSDLIVAADVENPLGLSTAAAGGVIVQPDWRLRLDGELCFIRRAKDGAVRHVALCRGRSVRVGDVVVKLRRKVDLFEVRFDAGGPAVVSGQALDVESISVGGRTLMRAAPFYADKTNLLAVVDADGRTRPVRSRRDWLKRRAHILENMQLVMGPLPEESEKVPLKARVLEESALPKATRRKITFSAGRRDRVPAYLFVPEGLTGRAPAMLCLHQTTVPGKAEPAGLAGSRNLHYALELARRGYVTLAPDYPRFGEYKLDCYARGYASATMKGVWNHMRAVDLLAGMAEVDAERIGCIGHSLGGYNAIFLAVFEPRIKVIVSSAGFNSFFKYKQGDLAGWSHAGHMPRIAEVYGKDPKRMPFDFTEVIAALAPRPFFASAPVKDHIFEVSGAADCIQAAAPVYELFGARAKLVAVYPDGGHDFPPEVRRAAYEFIDRALKRPRPAAGPDASSG